MAFMEAINVIMAFRLFVLDIGKISSASGPSFCQVARIKQLIHDIDDITDGNQKWHGAAPSFRSSLNTSTYRISLEDISLHINILESSIVADPRAWARKYFTALSVSWLIFVCSIIGINARRFSSMEIHAISQLVLDKAIIVLVIKIAENNIDDGAMYNIGTRRNWTP